MRALTESRAVRFFAFGALYFAQGVPWGFIAKGYVVFMTDAGLDNLAVGSALGLAYVPWSFKIVFGPLIDRFPSRLGRRRHFIIAAQVLMGATLLALFVLEPRAQLPAMAGVLFLHNTFAAMQDVATDALAVDVLPLAERGRANSVMWAGKSLGVLAGASGGLLLAKALSWPAVFVTMAALVWVVMLVPMLIRERRPGERAAAEGERFTWRELKRSFAFAPPLVGLAIAFLTPVGYALTEVVFTRMQRAELRLTEARMATIGLLEQVSAVVGALVGGALADRFGQRRAIAGLMLGLAVSMASLAAVPGLWPRFGFVAGWAVPQSLLVYAYNAATLGFFMTLSNPAIGATQFAIFMAGTNLTYAWTAPLAGYIADTWGYRAVYAIAAVVQLATIGLLPLCDPLRAEARFRPRAIEPEVAPELAGAPPQG